MTCADYDVFEDIIEEVLEVQPIRICCYCLMPNHWHLLLWPEQDGELARFMQRLITKHVRRGPPYGSDAWVQETARKLALESTLRQPHRPPKLE